MNLKEVARKLFRRRRKRKPEGERKRPFLKAWTRFKRMLRNEIQPAIARHILEVAEEGLEGQEAHERVVDRITVALDNGVLRFPATPVGIAMEIGSDLALRSPLIQSEIEDAVVSVFEELERIAERDGEE